MANVSFWEGVNMDIRKKLLLGFIGVILVFSLATGFFIFRSLDVKNKVSEINTVSIPSIVNMGWFNGAVVDSQRIILQILSETDQTQIAQEEKDLKSLLNDIKTKKDDYGNTLISSSEEKKLYDTFSQKWDAYSGKIPDILTAKDANNIIQSDIKYREAAVVWADAKNSIGALVKYNQDDANKAANAAKNTTTTTIIFAIIIFVIAVAIGLFVAIFLSNMIIKPIRAVVTNINEVANGNLTISDVKATSKDEVGKLGRSLNEMTANLRNIIHQVSISSERVASSSEQLTASAKESSLASNQVIDSITDMLKGVDMQNKEVGAAVAVVEQISSNINQISASASSVSNAADKTAIAAKNGTVVIEDAINQIKNIEGIVDNSTKVVSNLGEHSKEIVKIVDVISAIASQTNLLALNAAIEAARAGEHGKGFAVVADEVRKLAEQSQESAKQISNLINEIQNSTDKAVAVMSEGNYEVKKGTEIIETAGQTFNEIVSFINQVNSQIYDISSTIGDLAASSKQVVNSIQEIEKVSRNTGSQTESVSAATEEQSASMEEIANSSHELSSLAEELHGMVIKFKI